MIPEEDYGQLSNQQQDASDNEQEEAIEFISYAESDDDDEDPYFMPEHHKRTSTWTFLRLTCAPIQVVRFTIPALCIVTIVAYTITIAVLIENKKIANPQ